MRSTVLDFPLFVCRSLPSSLSGSVVPWPYRRVLCLRCFGTGRQRALVFSSRRAGPCLLGSVQSHSLVGGRGTRLSRDMRLRLLSLGVWERNRGGRRLRPGNTSLHEVDGCLQPLYLRSEVQRSFARQVLRSRSCMLAQA